MKRLALPLICWLVAAPAEAQTALVQSPAYQECTTLAATNPAQALEKAEGWLKIDNGTAAQHCRAMALYGLRRFAEAGDALTATRDTVPPEHYSMRSYLAQQAARAWVSANRADQALAALSTQLAELATIRGDNVGIAKLTAELLLERARLHITYGKLGDASQDLDHAVSLTPLNEEVLLERAGVFEKLGDAALARSDAQNVLKLAPGNAKAKELLHRLGGASAGASAPAASLTPAPFAAPVTVEGASTAAAPVTEVTASTVPGSVPAKASSKKPRAKAKPKTPASEAP